jgi:hypothetical protein
MATFNCVCGTGGIGNLGLPPCNDLLQVIARVGITATYDDDGNRNSIKASDLVGGKLPDGYFNDLLKNEDASKRIFITAGLFDDVEVTNTDRTTQTTGNGSIYQLLQGVMQFSGKLYEFPPAYSGQLNSTSCGENSVYLIDTEGRLMGEVSEDGTELYPLALQEGSLTSEWFPKSNASTSYVSLDFQLDRVVSAENFLTIPPSSIEENLIKAESLIDVTLTETDGASQSTTEIFVTGVYSLYGSLGKPGTLEGKVGIAPVYWTVTDSTGSDEALTAVVEESEGNYKLSGTFPAGVHTVKYFEARTKATKKGFESNSLDVTTS